MSEPNSTQSPAPGTPQTKTKAVAAGVVGTLSGFLSSLLQAQADNIVTQQEWTGIALSTVIFGAAAFGITWAVPNKPL